MAVLLGRYRGRNVLRTHTHKHTHRQTLKWFYICPMPWIALDRQLFEEMTKIMSQNVLQLEKKKGPFKNISEQEISEVNKTLQWQQAKIQISRDVNALPAVYTTTYCTIFWVPSLSLLPSHLLNTTSILIHPNFPAFISSPIPFYPILFNSFPFPYVSSWSTINSNICYAFQVTFICRFYYHVNLHWNPTSSFEIIT